MASKKTVNQQNLEALGAERLAGILLELGAADAAVKRRLRLELAGEAGPEAIAADIGRRIATLQGARSLLDWQQLKSLLKEIDLQRKTIAGRLAEARPDLALDLMWRLLALAGPVMDRAADGYGRIHAVFQQACRDLGAIALRASPDPVRFADRVFDAVAQDTFGQYNGLIDAVYPALTPAGVKQLKKRLTAALAARPKTTGRFDLSAPVLRFALQEIADKEGDVDAYIAIQTGSGYASPGAAAEMARRLLAAGRAEEALAILQEGANSPIANMSDSPPHDWERAWADALIATGRQDEAQRFRWACFTQRLDVDHLRAYLKALPEFDDVIAEEKAFDYASAFPDATAALAFYIAWPALDHAARLVRTRTAEIDGNAFMVLDPAAKALEGRHPLAATLLRRALIEDTLDGGKSSRYRHAARHLLECAALAASIDDYDGFETHEAFTARLRARHGRKTGFWDRAAALAGRT